MNNPFSIAPCQQVHTRNHGLEAEAISQETPPPESTISSQSSPVGIPSGKDLETPFIRAARPEDLSSIATLLIESFYPANGLMGWLSPLLRLGIYQELRGRLSTASPNRACLVAVQRNTVPGASGGHTLVGTIEVSVRSLSLWELSTPKVPYISNLAVEADCRRQGVAQHLLLTCERTVLEWGFRDLYLHVLDHNDPARQLYSKAGYRLHHIDPLWTSYLFRQPQRLLFHKQLQ